MVESWKVQRLKVCLVDGRVAISPDRLPGSPGRWINRPPDYPPVRLGRLLDHTLFAPGIAPVYNLSRSKFEEPAPPGAALLGTWGGACLTPLQLDLLNLYVGGQRTSEQMNMSEMQALRRPQHASSRQDNTASNVEDGKRLATLDEIVRRIVEVAEPERIILFGSAARGDMGPNSDVDLLVVKPGAHRRRLAQDIYMSLYGVGQAVELVVVTPEDIERYGDAIGLVIEPALREGKTIYVA